MSSARRIFPGTGGRKAMEHAWQYGDHGLPGLREYANEEVDIAKVMLMCLIHDIVEIDAGDTYAYDEENLKTQKARKTRQRMGFSLSCRRIRRRLTAILMNSRRMRPRKPACAFAGQLCSRCC